MADATEFSVFAEGLSTYFQGSYTPEEFTRQLFAHIYTGSTENTDPYVHDMEKRTLKGHYYAEHDITNTAKHIAGKLDLGSFAEFVKLDSVDSVTSLCDTFRESCPDITADTYEMDLAERFQTIINTAAQRKRRKRNTPTADVAAKAETAIESEPPRPPQEKYGFYLVSEEGSTCPNDGCTHSLFTNENGHLGLLYEVVIIDPDESADDPNNMIALCPECAARYKLGNYPLWTYRMREIKKQFQENASDKELLSEQKVQDGVRKVLAKIPAMRPDHPVDLNYDPVMLRKKIEPDNISLYLKTQAHVNYYFNCVHETFQEMGREGLLRFKPFCEQVKINYLNLKEQGRGQQQIYRQLTDWLQSGTNEERDYCEIVISYFIQKCEVFDVITE